MGKKGNGIFVLVVCAWDEGRGTKIFTYVLSSVRGWGRYNKGTTTPTEILSVLFLLFATIGGFDEKSLVLGKLFCA
jgi:hypothetical protein